jgi:hypothetical protein
MNRFTDLDFVKLVTMPMCDLWQLMDMQLPLDSTLLTIVQCKNGISMRPSTFHIFTNFNDDVYRGI